MKRDDEDLTREEVNELIAFGLEQFYERTYNEALDHVLEAYQEGGSLEDIIERIKGLKKSCYVSSSEKQ